MSRLRLSLYGMATMAALAVVSGCNTSGMKAEQPPSASMGVTGDYKGIKAFKDICLATAPSFSSAVPAAKRYGVKDFFDLGEGKSGLTPDNSLSAQIKPAVECAVTTPAYVGDRGALRAQFIAVVGAAAGVDIENTKIPFTAEIKGTKFIFTHDPKGGEAFVMLKAR